MKPLVAARVALTVGGLVTVAGSLQAWVRSGAADRSSYEIVGLVERLGFADDGPFAWLLWAWPLMPLAAAVGVVFVWWRLHRIGAAVSAAAGIYAGAVALAMTAAPTEGLVRTRSGHVVTAVGAVVMIVAAVAVVLTDRRA